MNLQLSFVIVANNAVVQPNPGLSPLRSPLPHSLCLVPSISDLCPRIQFLTLAWDFLKIKPCRHWRTDTHTHTHTQLQGLLGSVSDSCARRPKGRDWGLRQCVLPCLLCKTVLDRRLGGGVWGGWGIPCVNEWGHESNCNLRTPVMWAPCLAVRVHECARNHKKNMKGQTQFTLGRVNGAGVTVIPVVLKDLLWFCFMRRAAESRHTQHEVTVTTVSSSSEAALLH